MANVPPNDPNDDAFAIVPAPVNPDHAPAQPVSLENGFAPHWIGDNILNNQNGWIEEDVEEEEEDPKEDLEEDPEEDLKEDDDDDIEIDDEEEVINPYMDDGSNNPPPPNFEDDETPPTSPVILDANGNQDSRRRDTGNTRYKARENRKRPAKQDEHKAMVTIDGEGVDWTDHAEDDKEDYALIAFNSNNSGSDIESQVSLIMRTKPGVDTLSFDDLYKNLRVFKSDVKSSTRSSSSTQNVAFVSSDNTSSLYERQKRVIDDFKPMDSDDAVDKEKVLEEPDSTKAEVKKEIDEESIRKRRGRRLEMKATKKSKRQKIDYDLKEEEHLKTFMHIVQMKKEKLIMKFLTRDF
nr:hypothetical protein [Tanacetum cinerariifolium]